MKRQVTIEGLPLIARGGQAEIYDYGDGKVVRVAKRPQHFDSISYEYGVYSLLGESTLTVPRAYELVVVNGAPAIIMEKIGGNSMMGLIAKNPLSARARAEELARLHLVLSKVQAVKGIIPTKAKAEFCIKQSETLQNSTKERILEVLKELPDGNTLCHGDFHPGNIICHQGKNYIIDWVGASRGDFYADVAHTYLLLRVVPRVPHMNQVVHFMQRWVGRAMADRYLATVSAGMSLDYGTLSKWVLVIAAERTYAGLTSEKKRLHAFIDMYLEVLARDGIQDRLYKAI